MDEVCTSCETAKTKDLTKNSAIVRDGNFLLMSLCGSEKSSGFVSGWNDCYFFLFDFLFSILLTLFHFFLSSESILIKLLNNILSNWYCRCAFLNTPKYNQVKGKGKIVKRNWIEECHSQRRKLPWRRFALDKNEQKQPESEEEVLEEVVTNRAQRMDTDDDDYNEQYIFIYFLLKLF